MFFYTMWFLFVVGHGLHEKNTFSYKKDVVCNTLLSVNRLLHLDCVSK